MTATPLHFLHAAAAKTSTGVLHSDMTLDGPTPTTKRLPLDQEIMAQHDITSKDMAMVFLSPSPFHNSFEEVIPLRYFDPDKHPTAGMVCTEHNGRIYLSNIDASTPAAKIRAWRSRIRGAWIIQINGTTITSITDVRRALLECARNKATTCTILMAHSAIRDGLVETGIPQINADQLNHRYSFDRIDVMSQEEFDAWFASLPKHLYEVVVSGGVHNLTWDCNKLTRRILLDQPDWDEWAESEFLQLDQYAKQHMFGQPCPVTKKEAVFHLIWTYVVKELDGRKKARCTCDGSSRGGQVRVLDHTFANSIEQTGSRIFYAIAAAENLLVFGADVSNAFGEAPPPKQGFFIKPDKPFRDWYQARFGTTIPDNWVVPVLAAMQGHPESPRLWEKHCDKILRSLGFTPTTHEPCLYSGFINNEKVYFKRQVDDFAIACSN